MSVCDPVSHDPVPVLYNDRRSWLCGWLRKRRDNVCDATNVAQGTFIRVIVGGQANVIREPHPFLAIVAARLPAHRHRRRLRAYFEALRSLPEESAPAPEARLPAQEAPQALNRALDGLPLLLHKAFLLAHLGALPYRQIAARLRASASAVKQCLIPANRQCLFALTVSAARRVRDSRSGGMGDPVDVR